MNHHSYCSGDARNYCRCEMDPEINERIDVDAKAWAAQRRNVLICQILSAPILGWALAATLIHGPFFVQNPVKTIYIDRVKEVPIEKIVIKEVVKEVQAPPPDLDPDLVVKAHLIISCLRNTSNTWQLTELNQWTDSLNQIPLKERLEAHRQLGY